jgi:hypothetical protein
VVCDSTEIAEVFYQKISGERVVEVPSEDGDGTVKKFVYEGSAVQPELANSEEVRHTVRIDSELLKKIETEEGETRDEAGKTLREIINTVGKRGYPGEHVRCVVSVSMLTEGWDATNVTHILGVRAFASQLLCEQVVGRGLRRMSYTPDPESGLLSPEHVDVYGIPFSLIPFKGRPKDTDGTDPVYHHIFAVPERAAREIRVPVVDSYTYDVAPGVDWRELALERHAKLLRDRVRDGNSPAGRRHAAPADRELLPPRHLDRRGELSNDPPGGRAHQEPSQPGRRPQRLGARGHRRAGGPRLRRGLRAERPGHRVLRPVHVQRHAGALRAGLHRLPARRPACHARDQGAGGGDPRQGSRVGQERRRKEVGRGREQRRPVRAMGLRDLP